MTKKIVENQYLQEVLEEQQQLDRQLNKRARRSPPPPPPQAAPKPGAPTVEPTDELFAIAEEPLLSQPSPSTPPPLNMDKTPSRAIDYKVVGFLWWKSVIVPPNAYVIHTRRGHSQPIHLGRGISFRFNPLTDAFLVIPSAVQTILINARCICLEKQGILVQAYVQWIIDDLQTAYWKLDFSDPEDPMGIVNLQLREQAEAAIKDKVATLSIDEVLSDKQPIIEELTYRLRTVAEGSAEDGGNAQGLGLKIVTVQIKDAVVSSTTLWENLQVPFRSERQKLARLAELENEQVVNDLERENRLRNERADLEVTSQLEQLKAEQEQAQYNREYAERNRRQQMEETAARQKLAEENATAQVRQEGELELALQALALEQRRLTAEMEKLRQQMQLDALQSEQNRALLTTELELAQMRDFAQVQAAQRQLELERQRRAIENDLSEAHLKARLIAELPSIAENLPAPNQQNMTIISTDGQETAANSLLSFLSTVLSLFPSQNPED
ncbi:SPFH domain-containing protein [Spirulina subsalsa]|uniref:SPFH domain-containing protein n=1 Tax=Spirulina subsalsa TaxID=54311 RepID=UPI00031F436C|nr:SPFH domain-containing protein [Spirulina subsalsa]